MRELEAHVGELDNRIGNMEALQKGEFGLLRRRCIFEVAAAQPSGERAGTYKTSKRTLNQLCRKRDSRWCSFLCRENEVIKTPCTAVAADLAQLAKERGRKGYCIGTPASTI